MQRNLRTNFNCSIQVAAFPTCLYTVVVYTFIDITRTCMMDNTVLIGTTVSLERGRIGISWIYVENVQDSNILRGIDLYARVCLITVCVGVAVIIRGTAYLQGYNRKSFYNGLLQPLSEFTATLGGLHVSSKHKNGLSATSLTHWSSCFSTGCFSRKF